MINGVHAILFSKDPDRDRDFLRDVLQLPHVDVGGGWLIFGLPPTEIAVHPAEKSGAQELYLMCADVEAFIGAMAEHEIECSDVQDQGWGLVTALTLPGGGKLNAYQPRHARPEAPGAGKARAKPAASVRKKKSKARRPPARAPKAPARKAAKAGKPTRAAKKAARKR
jgi:hypothetical protein